MNQGMTTALEQARLAAQAGEIPVGAALYRGNELICAAHNLRETTGDPTAHAELLCMREGARLLGDWRLRDCTLYVTLEPCPMCAGAMIMSQLGQCIFGAADSRQGCCGSVYDLPGDAALCGITRWHGGVMAAECAAVLTDFFETRRSKGTPAFKHP